MANLKVEMLLCTTHVLGPAYTKRQSQRYDNAAMTLAILFSLKLVESLENRLQPHSGATPLFSMRTESQASSQRCRSIDAEAWCKRALTEGPNGYVCFDENNFCKFNYINFEIV